MASSSLNHISLPFELTEEILSAIPIEYLIRFHLICKQWYSLLQNKRFIYSYLDLTHQERFIRINNKVQIIDPVAQTRLNSPFPAKFPFRPIISTMIHCDGLVLLQFKNLELECRRLLIWNPILGQIKWIQPTSNFYGTNCFDKYREKDNQVVWAAYTNDVYGIGYDNNASRDDHKILRFYNRFPDLNEIDDEKIEIEIYDLKSNSWKFLEDTCDNWSLELSCKGVSVTGNMYWVAKQRNVSQFFIQSFDFSSETFKPRSNCLPFESHMNDVIALSCFRRDKLCLLHQIAETKEIEVWVSNKVDEEVMSWSKYLSVTTPRMPKVYANPGFFIDNNGKIRVWCEDGTKGGSNDICISVYEIGKDEIKEDIRLRFKSYSDYLYPLLSVYVPSLVPLTQKKQLN